MIVFGSAVTDTHTYERCAAPGISRVSEPDSEVIAHMSTGSLFRNYNLILDRVRGREGLEALVLIHQDAELVDPDFCDIVRKALEGPDVAIVGCAGAVGVRSIAWWDGAVTWAGFTHRYQELGGGEFAAMSWTKDYYPVYAELGEVDSIDGFVIVMSPWAVQNLRLDESLGTFHGYDFDLCMQARSAGKKVVTADFRAIHHHSLDLISDPEVWIDAYVRLVEKWNGKIPDPEVSDWKRHALREEAAGAAARAEAMALNLRLQAQAKLVADIERSVSWRLTAPLRWLRNWRRRRRNRRAALPGPAG